MNYFISQFKVLRRMMATLNLFRFIIIFKILQTDGFRGLYERKEKVERKGWVDKDAGNGRGGKRWDGKVLTSLSIFVPIRLLPIHFIPSSSASASFWIFFTRNESVSECVGRGGGEPNAPIVSKATTAMTDVNSQGQYTTKSMVCGIRPISI